MQSPSFWSLLLPSPLKILGSATVGLVLLGTGCITSSFLATDGRAVARPNTQPGLYIDRLPPQEYTSIGIIEVRAPAGTELGAVVQEALRKGGEVGCDFIVERSLYRISFGLPQPGAIIAQVGVGYAPVVQPVAAPVFVPSPPPAMREFICGVATAPIPRDPAPAAPAPPPPGDAGGRAAHVTASIDARTAPSAVAPVLTKLAVGQSIVVLGEPRSGWLTAKVTGERVGYVPASAVQLDEPR
jgi:hypothetical protein